MNPATGRFTMSRFNVDFGGRGEKHKRDTYRVVGGVDGVFNDDWSYEVSLNYGKLKTRMRSLNNLLLFTEEGELDGFEALWYSRGRYGSDDYQRMERQRCMVDAIIAEAKPWTLLRRYQSLAATGKEIVRTDIPSDLMPAFVDLASRVQGASVRSVVFRSSDEFSPGDPDFPWMRSVVRKALSPPPRAEQAQISRHFRGRVQGRTLCAPLGVGKRRPYTQTS